jgi:hypothetical protein
MKYGNISNVMVFKNEEIYFKAINILKSNGNGFETSGFPLAINFYPDIQQSFAYAQTDLSLAGIKDGQDYEVKYR